MGASENRIPPIPMGYHYFSYKMAIQCCLWVSPIFGHALFLTVLRSPKQDEAHEPECSHVC